MTNAVQLVRWACRTNFALLLEIVTSRDVLTISRLEILQTLSASAKVLSITQVQPKKYHRSVT